MTTNIRTQSAEDFQLLEVVITSNRFEGRGANSFNITPVTTEINIFENINEFYLTGNLMFVDDNNIFSLVDFKGTERVRITFKIPDPAAPNITKNFVVNSVVKTQKTNDYVNVILLSLIEDHGYYGELKVFSKVYDGKGENIINTIVREQLHKNVYSQTSSIRRDNITTFRESFQSKFRYIVPYITPFHAIKNILDKISTQNGAPYYLYSSLNTNDLILADLETMITRLPLNISTPFTFSQNQSNQPDLPQNIYQIYSIGDTNQEDTLLIGQMGALGASYANTNVSTGEISSTQYTVDDLYNTLKYQSVIARTDNNLIDELFVPDRTTRDPSTITEMMSRRFHQVSGETYPYDTSVKNWTEEANFGSYKLRMFKHSIRQLLLKNAYELLLPGIQFLTGDIRYSVGNQISIRVFENNFSKNTPSREEDPKRSGDFLVTSKRHIFKINPSTHTVVVGCTRLSKKV
jgi:hypothetical protein